MQRRQGFTITEMLVSMALILFIMAILSEAFVAGLGVFRDLKAIGDMDQKLRSALTILVRDLAADHFNNNGKLSALTGPPTEGFFAIQGGASIDEGMDPDGIHSYRAANHRLHFSVNLGANSINDSNVKLRRRENYFSANVSGSPLIAMSPFPDGANYRSQFGEVAFFLRANGLTTPAGLPLYTLYRRQLVVLTNANAATMNGPPALATWNAATYYDVSCKPGGSFNNMTDLANPAFRSLSPAYPIFPERGETAQLIGADILLSDVISFNVRILRTGIVLPVAAPDDTDFVDVPAPFIFDTATSPVPYKVRAVQVSIRVWDPKTLRARQITIVQDL